MAYINKLQCRESKHNTCSSRRCLSTLEMPKNTTSHLLPAHICTHFFLKHCYLPSVALPSSWPVFSRPTLKHFAGQVCLFIPFQICMLHMHKCSSWLLHTRGKESASFRCWQKMRKKLAGVYRPNNIMVDMQLPAAKDASFFFFRHGVGSGAITGVGYSPERENNKHYTQCMQIIHKVWSHWA